MKKIKIFLLGLFCIFGIEKVYAASSSISAKNQIEVGQNVTATVKITVKNFLQMDTIGTSCHMINEGSFTLQAIYINRNWKIRMEGLPQNEKQNHD